MKYLFRQKNSPVEFHNIIVNHDIITYERANKKNFMRLLKKIIRATNIRAEK